MDLGSDASDPSRDLGMGGVVPLSHPARMSIHYRLEEEVSVVPCDKMAALIIAAHYCVQSHWGGVWPDKPVWENTVKWG